MSVLYCTVLLLSRWPSHQDGHCPLYIGRQDRGRVGEDLRGHGQVGRHKEFKPPQIHAAVKSLKVLVGELVGVVGLVTRLVEPVVACGGLCGTPAVEIDQVQQDAKSGCLVIYNNRSVADQSQVQIQPAEVRRKDPGLSNAEIACAAIRDNLGVMIDPNEIEHSRQLSDFSISVKLRMSGQDSAWHRTCQAMYRKPVRTGDCSLYLRDIRCHEVEESYYLVRKAIEEGSQVSNLLVLYRSQRADLSEGQGGWTEDQVDILYT